MSEITADYRGYKILVLATGLEPPIRGRYVVMHPSGIVQPVATGTVEGMPDHLAAEDAAMAAARSAVDAFHARS